MPHNPTHTEPGATGYSSVNPTEDLRSSQDVRRAAVLRALNINPTGRGGLASLRRERLPKLFESIYAFDGLDKGSDPNALVEKFSGMYRQGPGFAEGVRGMAQSAMKRRDLLNDMPVDEALQWLQGTQAVANYGMNPVIARNRQRAVEDAGDQYWAGEHDRMRAGDDTEISFGQYLDSPAGQTFARILGLID